MVIGGRAAIDRICLRIGFHLRLWYIEQEFMVVQANPNYIRPVAGGILP